MRITCRFTLLVLTLSLLAAAQHEGHEGAVAPVKLMTGFGPVHHPVSTNIKDAQAFFDQGLALVYGFNHDEAGRSFQKAVELDPNLAMGWWGLAYTLGSNYNMPSFPDREKGAYDAITKAVALAPKASAADQAYIAALAKRYTFDLNVDRAKLAATYRDAMRDLSRAYPDDLDAATLFAESEMDMHPWELWTKDGKPGVDTEEIIATLESVLKRDPNHIGANHYYIHAVEASEHPERGLASAYRLADLAPASGHLVHMPSHIFIRTGDHERSVVNNAKAAAADRTYFESTGTEGMYKFMYYSHNLHFLAHANSMLGNYARASEEAKRLYDHVMPVVPQIPMLELFLTIQPSVLERFHQWDAILKMPEPQASFAMLHAQWHYLRGRAFVAKGDVASAAKELQALTDERAKLDPKAATMRNTKEYVLHIGEYVLSGLVADARGEKVKAEEMLTNAVDMQDSLHYIEPPDWFCPVRESLGAMLLRHGKAAEAEKVFRKDLDWNPRNGRSLFGLAESLRVQKKIDDAEFVQRQADAAWKNADVKLSLEML